MFIDRDKVFWKEASLYIKTYLSIKESLQLNLSTIKLHKKQLRQTSQTSEEVH